MLTSNNRPPSVPYTHAVGRDDNRFTRRRLRSPKSQLGKGNPARIPARIKRRRLIGHNNTRPAAAHLIDHDPLAEQQLTVDASVQFAPLASWSSPPTSGRTPTGAVSCGRVNRRAVTSG